MRLWSDDEEILTVLALAASVSAQRVLAQQAMQAPAVAPPRAARDSPPRRTTRSRRPIRTRTTR